MEAVFLAKAIEFRRTLHKHAEKSGSEKITAGMVSKLMESCHPDNTLRGLGGTEGLAFVFEGKEPGPTIVFRCELDAVPLRETSNLPYRSINQDVSHACGHDGHMAILAGLASKLNSKGLRKGRLVLLFQAAEETGTGAAKVIADERFKKLQPDFIFALHNLPGYPIGQVLIREGSFAYASKGMILRIHGISAHAAHPEKATSPTWEFIEILGQMLRLSIPKNSLITPVYARLGEIDFGTTPGDAEIMVTLRADTDTLLDQISKSIVDLISQTIKKREFVTQVSWRDSFSATINDSNATRFIKKAAISGRMGILPVPFPFRWSEDFGEYLKVYPGALFGLGAGEGQASLHHPEYDFPEELIELGVEIFEGIERTILSEW
jgi:amidohydrolase